MARKLGYCLLALSMALFFLGTGAAVAAADQSKKSKKSKNLSWNIRAYSKGFVELSKSGGKESITFHLIKTSESEVRKVLGRPQNEKMVGDTEEVTYHLGHLPVGKPPEDYYSPMMVVTINYGKDKMISGIVTELDKEKMIRVKRGTWVVSK